MTRGPWLGLLAAAVLATAGAVLLAACGDEPAGDADADIDADTDPDADADIDADTDPDADADPDDGGPGPVLVEVGHEREVRGVWVASVSNINFPSRQGLAAEALRGELGALLDTIASVGLNAVFFQVRPEGDALYASELEPWSRYLTGTQGRDPGLDPLEVAVAEGHRRGLEVHAWLNPYRAKASSSSTAVAPHMSVVWPEHAHRYGSALWMDPGAAPVQERLRAVIRDLVARYDLDGIHFDDYFYPYPDGTPFPDDATYSAYVAGGGSLDRADWRRDNVNRLVEAVAADIRALRPEVRFGISPFGIYRPGVPEGIVGLDQYAAIYADPVLWIREGWVEYLAPQLYWPTTSAGQPYEVLLDWWSSLALESGRTLLVGNYLSRLGDNEDWSVDEIRRQVELARERRGSRCLGNVFFQVAPFQQDRLGIATVFREEYYARPALTPPLAIAPSAPLAPPRVELEGIRASLVPGGPEAPRAWTVYRDEGTDGFALERIERPSAVEIELAAGRWALAAVARDGRESLGVVVEVE